MPKCSLKQCGMRKDENQPHFSLHKLPRNGLRKFLFAHFILRNPVSIGLILQDYEMMPFLSTFYRYITVEILSSDVSDDKPLGLKSGVFHETVINQIHKLHGDFGIAAVRSGFLAKYCNENTRIAILRSRHGPHKLVTSSLPFISKLGKLNVQINTLHIGATLKHSFKFIQKHQRTYLNNMWEQLNTQEERRQLEISVMDFTKTDVCLNIEKMN